MAQQREAWEAIHGLRFPSVTVSHVPWTSIPRKFLHVGIVLATELAPQSDLPKAILHVSECATLADYQVRLLHASGCASVYVVLGAEAERAREELAAHQTIVNELWRQGRVSSIQAVLKALDRYDGCLIVPVDALGILDDTLQLVIETAEVGEHAVIRPSYDQHPGRLLWLNRVAAAEVAVLCATSDTSFDEFLSSHTLIYSRWMIRQFSPKSLNLTILNAYDLIQPENAMASVPEGGGRMRMRGNSTEPGPAAYSVPAAGSSRQRAERSDNIMKSYITLLVAVLAIAGCSEWPGGMRPTYPARDHDPRLTAYAKTALPLIAAIEAYHDRTTYVPSSLTEIAEDLPDTPSLGANAPDQWRGWFYDSRNDEYTLTKKLGWDPALIFRSSDASWIFYPGDGSPEKIVVLDVINPDRGTPTDP